MISIAPMNLPAVKFERPPIIEVAFGVTFRAIPNFTSARVGEYWKTVQSDYPKTVDQPPLAQVTEAFDEVPAIELSFGPLPPMRRAHFIAADELSLIQVQADRFHFNRRRTPPQQYVHFSQTKPMFETEFGRFQEFIKTSCGAELTPRQFELTYVNVIPAEGPLLGLNGLGEVFRNLSWSTADKTVLGTMENVQWQASFRMPNQQGRLHVHLANGVLNTKDGTEKLGLQLQITVRGYSKAMSEWFDLAHGWIVNAFADLTTDTMHKYWGRVN